MTLSTLTEQLRSFFQYGSRLKPSRDWLLILTAGIVFIGISIGWNSLTFLRLTRGEALIETTEPNADSALQNPIEVIRSVFKERAEEEQKYQSEYHFVDPSR